MSLQAILEELPHLLPNERAQVVDRIRDLGGKALNLRLVERNGRLLFTADRFITQKEVNVALEEFP